MRTAREIVDGIIRIYYNEDDPRTLRQVLVDEIAAVQDEARREAIEKATAAVQAIPMTPGALWIRKWEAIEAIDRALARAEQASERRPGCDWPDENCPACNPRPPAPKPSEEP